MKARVSSLAEVKDHGSATHLLAIVFFSDILVFL